MLQSPSLIRKRIANGVYEGVYTNPKNTSAAPLLELNYLGAVVSEVLATQSKIKKVAGLSAVKFHQKLCLTGFRHS